MAWNRPSEREQGIGNREQGARKSPFRGLIAGAVVVLGAAVAAWWLWPTGETRQDAASTKKELIKEVKPAVAPTNAPVEKSYKEMSKDEKIKYWRDKYGDNLPENIKPIVYYLENPPQQRYRGKSRPEAIFHHKSERQIAAFLSVTPGNWVMRPKVFDKSFDDDFAQSMAEKIEITSDDTEEQRRLKQLVIDAKKELVARLKAGEKPSEIMTATVKELYDLGQYRRNLQKEVIAAQHDPDKSDQDVADTVEAANKMLEAKGLKGLRTIHSEIRQEYMARRAKQDAKKAARTKASEGGSEK